MTYEDARPINQQCPPYPVDKLEEKIRAYFLNKKEVVAVYLFGSYAEGRECHLSDIDIGILLDRRDQDFAHYRRQMQLGLITKEGKESLLIPSFALYLTPHVSYH